jgi:hypothetical protein
VHRRTPGRPPDRIDASTVSQDDSTVSQTVAGLWAHLLGPGSSGQASHLSTPGKPGSGFDTSDESPSGFDTSGEPSPDFFATGGDSLLAMRLVSALRARTGREVAVEDVFAGRTLAGLSARVAAAPLIGPDAVPAMTTTRLPPGQRLSPGQRRLWFVEQLTPGTPAPAGAGGRQDGVHGGAQAGWRGAVLRARS